MSSKDREQEMLKTVRERYDAGAKAMRDVIMAWEEARLFYRGDQWIKPMGNKWAPSKLEPYRVRLTVNKFIPTIESMISSYLKSRPIILANAATDEDDDVKTAKISELLLRYYFDELRFDDLNFDTVLWLGVTGSAFQRVRWDPTKGRRVPSMPQMPPGMEGLAGMMGGMPGMGGAPGMPGMPVMEGLGGLPGMPPMPMAQPELVSVGQPMVDILSPFAVTPEPGAERFHESAWVVVTEIMLKSDIEDRWGVKVEEDSSSTGLHIPLYVDRETKIIEKDRVPVHTYYERPSGKVPNGRIIYATQNKFIHVEDLPFGEIQIEHFRAIPLPGELWPTSLVTQGVPLQLELNRGRSQLIENRNLCSRPQIMAAFGAIERETWTNKPGDIINWDPIAARGIEPHYLSPPQVPQWVMNILQIAEEDLADLSSRHDVSQGQTSSNVTSGRQAAIYQGADTARLTPSIRRFERSLERVGRWLLREAKENLSGEQIIRIVGRNRMGEYLRFQANDVSDTCNVRYEIASQLPWARESQRQQIMYLNSQGKIDDQTMFELLEMPTNNRIWESEQSHKLNARYENERLKQGYFPPLTTDNHAVHLREHEESVNLPENRERLIQEMQAQAGLQGQEAQIPGSIQAILNHMEAHKKQMPAPQPQPPMTRVNLNVERLITQLAATNPEIAAQLLPYAQDLMGDASGYQGAPITPETINPPLSGEGAPPDVTGANVGTPPGGMDGQMYQPGVTQPTTEEMFGGSGGGGSEWQ